MVIQTGNPAWLAAPQVLEGRQCRVLVSADYMHTCPIRQYFRRVIHCNPACRLSTIGVEEDLRRPRHALEPCLAHFTAMEDSANASLLQRRRESSLRMILPAFEEQPGGG